MAENLENTAFLEKVKTRAQLEDIYDARDIVEVVFRTMRDLMTTEASDRVAAELQNKEIPAEDKALQENVANLWQDTNLLVRFLSRIRPPLDFEDDTFLFRISQEAGLSRGVSPEMALGAVFSATKEEISAERAKEIEGYLPGKVKQIWQNA